MITKEEINNALNVLDVDKIPPELFDAFDTIQIAAQKYANIGADNYKEQATDKFNKEYARGYSQAREDIEHIIKAHGAFFPKTDADFSGLEVFTIHTKKGEPVIFRRLSP